MRLSNGDLLVSGHLGDAWFLDGGNGFLYRALPDGEDDASFGNAGVALSPSGSADLYVAAAELKDGTIMQLGGGSNDVGTEVKVYDELSKCPRVKRCLSLTV